jgi:hypothetical protein
MPDLAPEPAAAPPTQVANAETAPPAAPMVVADAASALAAPPASSAPAPAEPLLAGRAPQWSGACRTRRRPSRLPAARSSVQVAQAVIAPRAAPQPAPVKPAVPAEMVWRGRRLRRANGTLAAPGSAAGPPRPSLPGQPAEILLAGPAPEPARAMPEAMAEARSAPTVEADIRAGPAVTLAQAPSPRRPSRQPPPTRRSEPVNVALGDQSAAQPAEPVAGKSESRSRAVWIAIDGASGRGTATLGSIPFSPDRRC